MWLQVFFLCFSCLPLSSQSQPQERAFLRRSNDHAGRCHYTFTVASPEESSCSGSSLRPEMDGVLSRLTLLEALVSRLIAGVDGSAGTGVETTGEEVLQEAYSQVTGEKNQLQQDKEHLNRQVQELQRRLDEQIKEAESLRQKPCQQTHTSGGTQHENRPARGMLWVKHSKIKNYKSSVLKRAHFLLKMFCGTQQFIIWGSRVEHKYNFAVFTLCFCLVLFMINVFVVEDMKSLQGLQVRLPLAIPGWVRGLEFTTQTLLLWLCHSCMSVYVHVIIFSSGKQGYRGNLLCSLENKQDT